MVFKGVHQTVLRWDGAFGGVTSNNTLAGIMTRIYFTLTPFGDWDAPEASSFRHSDLDVRLGLHVLWHMDLDVPKSIETDFNVLETSHILRHTHLDVPSIRARLIS